MPVGLSIMYESSSICLHLSASSFDHTDFVFMFRDASTIIINDTVL